MKEKTRLLPLLLVPFLLSGCGQVNKYAEHLDDYVFTMKYHKNFNILQLTDIHWCMNSSTYEYKIYMDKSEDKDGNVVMTRLKFIPMAFNEWWAIFTFILSPIPLLIISFIA